MSGVSTMQTDDSAPSAASDGEPAWTPTPRKRMGLGLAVCSALLAGCSPPAYTLVGADPADASARVSPVGYRSVVQPVISLRPTTPTAKAWREQNDRAGSAPKSGR